MIKPTTSTACFRVTDIAIGKKRMQDLALNLTPALRLVVLLHHQRDHVQLLLMGVVRLQAALRTRTDKWQ